MPQGARGARALCDDDGVGTGAGAGRSPGERGDGERGEREGARDGAACQRCRNGICGPDRQGALPFSPAALGAVRPHPSLVPHRSGSPSPLPCTDVARILPSHFAAAVSSDSLRAVKTGRTRHRPASHRRPCLAPFSGPYFPFDTLSSPTPYPLPRCDTHRSLCLSSPSLTLVAP